MSTPTAIRSQSEVWARAPWDIATAFTTGWSGYLGSAVRRGAGPLQFAADLAEWTRAATKRSTPEWSTAHEVVKVWPEARLLSFSVGKTAVPTLFLPPQAGHSSTIVDYSATQSQVLIAREAGLDDVYCLDWRGATDESANSSIEEYVAIIKDAIEVLGGRVNLIGDCQGGWLAAIYAALHPDTVHSLSVGGAPIDFHAGDSAIRDWMGVTSVAGPMTPYRAMVAMGRGKHQGKNQVTGFKMLEPAGEFSRLMDLWANIDNPAHISRFEEFTNWFEWTQDVPGAFYLWIVEHLFVNNELIAGALVVGGEKVDLGRITAPLFLLAGTQDHITPADQVWALGRHTSTPEDQIHQELVDAGHLGLFMGRASLRNHWLPGLSKIAALPAVQAAK